MEKNVEEQETQNKPNPKKMELKEPIKPEEAIELINYAAENGIDPKAETTGQLYKAVNVLTKVAANEQEINAARENVLKLYSSLTAKIFTWRGGETKETDLINGRTLLDTEHEYKRHARLIQCWGLLFLLLAFGTESLDLWFADIVEPEEGYLLTLINVHRHFLDNFSPFFWGALGSCVYLMKMLSDKAADRCFDAKRWKGWGTRIILGAVMGTVIVYVFYAESFKEEGLHLDANAIAFLTGVGVKVIYGGIEKTIDAVAEKFDIGARSVGKSATPPEKPEHK